MPRTDVGSCHDASLSRSVWRSLLLSGDYRCVPLRMSRMQTPKFLCRVDEQIDPYGEAPWKIFRGAFPEGIRADSART